MKKSNLIPKQFQSTLPRRERLNTGLGFNLWLKISIHAPAKGATTSLPQSLQIKAISIHAPAKGATDQKQIVFLKSKNFNPRSREGSDTEYVERTFKKYISIHAPAKGATAILSNFISYIFRFSLIFTNIFLLIFYF